MEDVSIVGLDLAKRVFQVHGATSDGRAVCRNKLSRGQLRCCLCATTAVSRRYGSMCDIPFLGP